MGKAKTLDGAHSAPSSNFPYKGVNQRTVAGGTSVLPVLSLCDWKRCKQPAVYRINLGIDDAEPELCDKHMTWIYRKTGNGCHDE